MTRTGVQAVIAIALIAFAASVLLLTRIGIAPGDAVIAALPPAVLFAFVGFAARFACRALPLRSSSFSRLAGSHAAGAAMASGLWLLAWRGSVPQGITADSSLILPSGVLLYGLVIAMHYLMLEVEAARQAEEAALRYQLLAREAELKAFKAQVDPHFLFNSLNAVAALCGSSPSTAREMAQLLADFFRQTLRVASLDRIPLGQEIELASRYLAIEKVRFGDRLRVSFEIDEASRDREVPPLLLQPLVENAVRHGIAHTLEGGTVSVVAKTVDDVLHIRVENPADEDRPASRGEGIGLQNARGRLLATSEGRGNLRASEANGIFRVDIEVPA